MKRLVAFFLAVMMLLSVALASTSTWQIQEFVDEFNDPTGDKYIVAGPFEGTFSNSATSNSELLAYVFCDGNNLWIELHEYGTFRVVNTFSRSKQYNVAIKVTLDHLDFTSSRFYFKGIISGGSDRLYVSDDMYLSDFASSIVSSEVNGVTYENIIDVLKRSKDVKFAISSADKSLDKYNFAISDNGDFDSALKAINKVSYSVGDRVVNDNGFAGTIKRIYKENGREFVEVRLDNGMKHNYQVPWSFENGILKIVE